MNTILNFHKLNICGYEVLSNLNSISLVVLMRLHVAAHLVAFELGAAWGRLGVLAKKQ